MRQLSAPLARTSARDDTKPKGRTGPPCMPRNMHPGTPPHEPRASTRAAPHRTIEAVARQHQPGYGAAGGRAQRGRERRRARAAQPTAAQLGARRGQAGAHAH
jgi:hypothetical protein